MRSHIKYSGRKPSGFSFVELLVVIAIISVLAALLLPALEASIYHARLTSCANNLRQIGAGLMTYTGDFNGRFPRRQIYSSAHMFYAYKTSLADPKNDDRWMLSPYMDLDTIGCCPLSALAPGRSMMRVDARYCYSSYGLWFGETFPDKSAAYARNGIFRPGDTFYSANFPNRRIGVLASDLYQYNNGQYTRSAHPDRDGVLRRNDFHIPGPYGATHCEGSIWFADGGRLPGAIDFNILYGDTSVRKISDVDSWTIPNVFDPRLTKFIAYSNYCGLPAIGQ